MCMEVFSPGYGWPRTLHQLNSLGPSLFSLFNSSPNFILFFSCVVVFFYFLVVCVNLSFTFWHFSVVRYPICSKSTNGECMLMNAC